MLVSIEKEINMDIIVGKDKEKTYFEIPFHVPENIAKLEVSYSYTRRGIKADDEGNVYNKEINIIDLAVRDESKYSRGASGSERLYFYITENEATPGYVPGEINEGEWAVIFGAYKIEEEGCPVKLNIKYTQKGRILLKGDLHAHSFHSDGKYDVSEVINIAKLHGMDFMFLTDHNTFSQNDHLVSNDSMVVIPGMEWTHYKGHANFLGVKRPIKHFVANDKDTVIKIIEEARNNGALVTLNHPHCNFCPWEWGFDVPYDAIEIWNGPMKESEYRAVEWWHSKLVEGDVIPVVGGSDSHKNELFRMIGSPTTFLYSDSRGQSDIMAAIRKGHAFISYTSNGPQIDLCIEDSIMGDTVKFSEGLKGILKVENLSDKDAIKLISDKGIEKVVKVEGQSTRVIGFEVEDRVFYRVEVWREVISKLPALVSITNPIYIRKC